MGRIGLWVAAAALWVPGAAAAQDTPWNRYTLDGLRGVYVRAETNLGCVNSTYM